MKTLLGNSWIAYIEIRRCITIVDSSGKSNYEMRRADAVLTHFSQWGWERPRSKNICKLIESCLRCGTVTVVCKMQETFT